MTDDSIHPRILLAEDNLSTGKMYKQIMETKGFDVDHVVNGQQAFEYAYAGGYTLILMDIRMPLMEGLEVLQKLQETPPLKKNGPIVMLTNLSDEDLVKKAMSLGALSYVDKSNLNPEQLVEKINGVLGLPMLEEEKIN